jgi:hypothetical protein
MKVYGRFTLFALIRLTEELSTPFINARLILLDTNRKDTKLFLYNSYMIVATFTLCRFLPIVPYWIKLFSCMQSAQWLEITNVEKFLFVVSNIPLDALNLYWYIKIVKGAFRLIKKKKSASVFLSFNNSPLMHFIFVKYSIGLS